MRTLFLLFLFGLQVQGLAQTPKFNSFFFKGEDSESKVALIKLTSLGKYFYDDSWNAGNIYLKNGDSLIAYYLRYDLIRNQLEIIVGNDIAAIRGDLVDHFKWFNTSRLKTMEFMRYDPINTLGGKGFLELLQNGKVKLLKQKTVLALREATSPTLVNGTGSNIQTFKKYYFISGAILHEVVNSKKKNLEFFNSEELSRFVQKNHLKFNNEFELGKIVAYYNQLQH